MRLSVFFVFLAVFLPISAFAQHVDVEAVRIHDHGTHTRIVFDMDALVTPEIFTLDQEAGRPYRVVIDLPEVTWSVEGGSQFDGDGVIRQVRYARNRPGRSRIVLDMHEPATVSDVQIIPAAHGEPAKIVLDLTPIDQESFTAASGFPDTPPPEPTGNAEIFDSIEDVLSSLEPSPDSGLDPGMQGPMMAPNTEVTEPVLALPVVVIDPGHGGRDPGATTVSGVQEKTIALEIGRAMRDALNETGLFEVHMTRNEDILLPLNERYAIAQDLAADLFISIHVDSNDSVHARGVTVYTLSENASDAEAAAVARRENQSDRVAGYEVDEELTRILIDLAQRETMNLSAQLATILVRALDSADLRTVSRPHRFAGFRVLTAPDVPSILLETGFASNPQDAALLVSDQYQEDLSLAMAVALVRYFDLGDPGELWLEQHASARN